MRLLAVTCVPSAPLGLLLAQAVDAPWSLFAEGGSVVVLGWAVYYLLTKTLPQQQRAAEASRVAFSATLDRIADRYEERDEKQREGQQQMVQAIQDMQAGCIRFQSGQRAKEREEPG